MNDNGKMDTEEESTGRPSEHGEKLLPKNIGDLSSLLAGVGVALYAVGFVVWQIHLESFGASGPSLFQPRFISAGLCYAVFCSAFVLPSATILSGLLSGKDDEKSRPKPTRRTLGTVLTLWFFLVQAVVRSLLPSAFPHDSIYLLVGLPVALSFAAKLWKTERWKSVRDGIDSPLFAFGGATAVFMVVACWSEPILIPFIAYSLLVWALIRGEGRAFSPDAWRHSSHLIRVMSYVLGLILALTHTAVFSKCVFPLVPHQFGGGAPERALLVTENQIGPTLLAMGFQATNEFIGPVEIVARDDNYLWISVPEDRATIRPRVSIQLPMSSIRLTKYISKVAAPSPIEGSENR